LEPRQRKRKTANKPINIGRKRKAPYSESKPTPKTEKQTDPHILNPPKDNSFADYIFKIMNRRIEEAVGNEPLDSAFAYSDIKETVLTGREELIQTLRWYDQAFKEYTRKFGGAFSRRAWIKNDKKIMANLNKKRNRYLIPIMDFLAANALPYLQTEGTFDKIIIGKKKRVPIVVKPNEQAIMEYFGISRTQIWTYLKGAARAGFIMKMDKRFRSHEGHYYILGSYGWYNANKDKPKKDKDQKAKWDSRHLYFMKGTKEIKQALRTFRRPD